MKRDFTRLADITIDEAWFLLDRTEYLKKQNQCGADHATLAGKSLAMIFEKASTRTRISFEVGMRQLGGYTIFLSSQETQIGRGEPAKDTARVLSRYVNGIMIRTYAQEIVDELARWATVPVINGLTDLLHPCQILADLYTIREFKGDLTGLRIAYVGDGNNIANSWLEAANLFGLNLSIATPEGYMPDQLFFEKAKENGRFNFSHEPREAVAGADVVNTDVWVSMGQEKEKVKRRQAFSGYQVDADLMSNAKKDAIVMHCLPAYRNEEISEEVFEKNQDIIFTQAENRMHAQKALLEWLMTTG